MNWRQMIQQIRFDLTGATTVEYGLILAMISLAMIGAFQNFADSFQSLWTATTELVVSLLEG